MLKPRGQGRGLCPGGTLGDSPPSAAQVWVGRSPAPPTALHCLGPSRVWVSRARGALRWRRLCGGRTSSHESWARREPGGQARPLEVDEEPQGVGLWPHSALWAPFLQRTADSSESVRDSQVQIQVPVRLRVY